MNKEKQCRTSKKDGKLLRNIFFNKCPEILCTLDSTVYCVVSHGRDDAVDQSMDGVCSSNLPGPFQALSTPTEGTAQYGSVRATPTIGGGNATSATPLQTEPTRTLRISTLWKCAIICLRYHDTWETLELLIFCQADYMVPSQCHRTLIRCLHDGIARASHSRVSFRRQPGSFLFVSYRLREAMAPMITK